MYFNKLKYLSIVFIACTALLSGCKDELLLPGEGGSDNLLPKDEVPVLQFDIMSLPNAGATRNSILNMSKDDELVEMESYINPNKLRVLFFTNKIENNQLVNKFLFEVEPRFVSKTKVDTKDFNEEPDQGYRVTLTERDIYTGMSPEVAEAVEAALYDEGFKVVVMANFPTNVEGHRVYDHVTGDPLVVNGVVPTNLNFKPLETDISEISHCVFDNVYGDYRTFLATDKSSKNKSFHHVVKPSAMQWMSGAWVDPKGGKKPNHEGKMGIYSVWVRNFFSNFNEVDNFIRDGIDNRAAGYTFLFDKDIPFNEETGEIGALSEYHSYDYVRNIIDNDNEFNTYTFQNIWRVWNFSAGKQTDGYVASTGEASQPVHIYWASRNQNKLLTPMQADAEAGKWNSDSRFEYDGFTVVSSKEKPITYNRPDGYLVVPPSTFDRTKPQDARNVLHFKAYGEGRLYIKATSDDGAKLKVIGNERSPYFTGRILPDESEQNYNSPSSLPSTFQGIESNDTDYDKGWEYVINPQEKTALDVYIIVEGGTAKFYEVEFIRDRHLYDTGRISYLPSADKPIPMYGVQDFAPIRPYVRKGYTLNISNIDENEDNEAIKDYPFRRVYLLRSVAKVELYFKISAFSKNPPSHVYMRSMNRSARSETKDVVTPTDILWYGSGDGSGMNGMRNYYNPYNADPDNLVKYLSVDQEFDNICEFPPLYNKDDTSIDSYRNFTTWYHACWVDRGWDWDNSWPDFPEAEVSRELPDAGAITPDKVNNPTLTYQYHFPGSPYPDNSFPRIYNPRIDRSDFCRFHYVGIVDGHYKYVLYMPEKNVDDADSKGDRSASPKIAHIEVRFKGLNTSTNFDDNNHYRIYFTDYKAENGLKNDIRGTRDETVYSTLEKDRNFLDQLQPIMRNYTYRFYIESLNKDKLGINFTVCGAAPRGTYNPGSNNNTGTITFN